MLPFRGGMIGTSCDGDGPVVNDLILIEDTCSRCGELYHQADNFCRKCGLPTGMPASDTAVELVVSQPHATLIVTPSTTVAPLQERSLLTTVLGNRVYVLAVLFCAGPIGLPALWFSPRFTRAFKIVVTAVYFFLTAVVPLAVAWYFLDIAVRPLLNALAP